MTVQNRIEGHFGIRPKPIDTLRCARALRRLRYARIRRMAQRFDYLMQSLRMTQVRKARDADFLAYPIFHRVCRLSRRDGYICYYICTNDAHTPLPVRLLHTCA